MQGTQILPTNPTTPSPSITQGDAPVSVPSPPVDTPVDQEPITEKPTVPSTELAEGPTSGAKPEPVAPTTDLGLSKAEPAPIAPVESNGFDIALPNQIQLKTPIVSTKPLNPDVINNIANTAQLASNGLIPKDTIAGTVTQFGPEAVREQFAIQKQIAQVSVQMSKAKEAAAAGDVDGTIYYVDKAKQAQSNFNNGAMEDYAITNLTAGTPQQYSVTADLAKKVQYLKNIQLELQNQYEDQTVGEKIGEAVMNILPLSYNIAVTGTGDPNNGTLRKLYDQKFDPDVYAAVNTQKLLALPYDDFVKEVGRIQKDVREKSKTFGFENTSLQQQVFNGMLRASNFDRVMDQVFTVLDVTGVGQIAGDVGKGVAKTSLKAIRGAKTAETIIKAAAESPEVALHSGAITTTAKQVGQSDRVATKVIQSINTNKGNDLVPSAEAAYKNLAPMHEPLSIRDSASAQALNLDSFYNGVGARLAEYQDDRQVAEVVSRLKEVQSNRSFTPQEMEEAISKAQLNYANDNIDFHVTAEHGFNEGTLEPVIKARITQNAGQGWETKEAAQKFIDENFKISQPYTIEQDVSGKHIIVVDHGLDDFATMKDIEMKEPGALMRVINKVYYGPKRKSGGGEVRKGSSFSIVNQMGTIPEEEHKSGITALTANLDLLRVKNNIYKRNINTLGTRESRDLINVADFYRNKEGFEWPSIQEVTDNWRTITGKNPTVAQLRSWNDYKLLNDIDYTMANLSYRNLLKDRNYFQLRLKTDNPELTNPIAKKIESFDEFNEVPYIYDVDESAFKKLVNEEEFAKLKESGSQFFRLGDYVKMVGDDGQMQRVSFVTSKSAKIDDLPAAVMPYRANGRIDYAGDWFAKQANVQDVVINGKTKSMLHPPITHAIGERRIDIEKFVEKTNKAIRKYKEVKSIEKQGKVPSEESMNELRKLWADTRWQTLDNFEKDLKDGKATLGELEAVGNRQKLKMGEKYAKENTGRLTNSEEDDQDLEILFNLSRRGERKLDPNGAPAKLKSPFITLDQAINKDIKKITFQNFVKDAADRWHQTFREDLVDQYANPVNAVIHGNFKRAVDPNRQALGRRYQSWLRNLARLGFSESDAEIDSMAQMVAKWEQAIDASTGINKDFARAAYGINKWWRTANPMSFFRGLMFKANFGLYNYTQIFKQSTQAAIVLGTEVLLNPKRGVKAIIDWGKGMSEEATHAIQDARMLEMTMYRKIGKDIEFMDDIAKKMKSPSKPSEMFTDYHDAGIDSIQRYMGQAEDMDYIKPMPAILEDASDLIANAKEIQQKVSKSGDIFFDVGTKIGNYAGFSIARLRLIKRFEKQYGRGVINVPDSPIRRQYLRDLRYETEKLSMAQSRASNLTIQQAHNEFGFYGYVAEMMTQYMQYNAKLLTYLLPKSLGGSEALSASQKIAMNTVVAGLTGSSYFPFHNWVSSELFLHAKELGIYTGTAEEWQSSVYNQGVPNYLINVVFGLTGDQKATYGQNFSPWSQVDDMIDVWVGDKAINTYIGGPLLSKFVNAWESVTRYTAMRKAMGANNDGFMNSYGVGVLLAALEGSVSSAGNLNRLISALKSDKVLSNNGYAVARSNDAAAWLNFIGISVNPYETLEFYRRINDKYEDQVSDAENVMRRLVIKRTELVNAGEYEKADQVDMAISSQMSLIPANERGRFIRGMFKNFAHPSLEVMQQRLQKKIEFLTGGQ